MANWGGAKPTRYKDGTLVPIAADRCQEAPGSGHVCKLHSGHNGTHECICDKEWDNELV